MLMRIVTKFGEDQQEFFELENGEDSIGKLHGSYRYRRTFVPTLRLRRGHNSEVSWTIWLVIKFDRDIMPMSIMTKFGEDLIRIVPS